MKKLGIFSLQAILFATLVLCGCVAYIAFSGHYVMNRTTSVPFGIYRIDKFTPSGKGYVLICPPDNAFFKEIVKRNYVESGNECNNSTVFFIKHIAGSEGDYVVINENGVYINGSIWVNSKPMENDSNGELMPKFRYDGKLGKGEYIFMGETKKSLDSRYFGVLNESVIINSAVPILLF